MDRDLDAQMVQESPDALIALDSAGGVRLWNRSAEVLFGYAAKEAIGEPLAALIDPPGGTPTRDELAQAGGDAVVQTESMRRRSDGALIVVNATLRSRRDVDGRVEAFFYAMSDVTPMRVERDSRLVHARYHGLLEFAPDAIVIVNDTGRIVLFNAQAQDMFGHRAHQIIGSPIEVLLPHRVRRAHVGHRNGYLDAPRMRPMGLGLDLHGVRANGDEFPVEISLSPIEIDGGGRLVMSAIRDTTERKRIERALHDKNLELERASRAKDQFLATMSHELRTPLNAILGFAGLLLMQLPGPLNDAQRRQLEHVQSSGKHLLSLINDLLDLAKIDSGRVELMLEPVDCVAVLDEVTQTLKPAASAKGLALECDPAGGPLLAMADRRALHQVVLNLANNAVKFTQRGEVRLSGTSMVDGDGRTVVELAVTDTGVGISAADQSHLFEAFKQLGDRRARATEGTGLGLHLSRKLAELMNGRIVVDSRPGIGSRFALQIVAAGE